jgi:hypothetical protein
MHNWPKGYQEKIEIILDTKFSGDKINFSLGVCNNIEDAKLLLKKIILMKKQLSAIKSEANNEMKIIRSAYQIEKEKVNRSSSALTTLLLGKRAAGRERQSKKFSLSAKQKSALAPYENVKVSIDRLLLEIDRIKLNIETDFSKR